MCLIINGFFTVLIDVVQKYGGDVIKFSGDALTVVFPVLPSGGVDDVFDKKRSGTGKGGNASACAVPEPRVKSLVDSNLDILMEIKATFSPDIKTACLRATQCSLSLHKAVLEYSETDARASDLSLHTCVGYGDVTLVHLGGVFGRYEYVMAGAALDQIAAAEHYSESKMTVLSHEATKLIGDHIKDGEQVGPADEAPAEEESAAHDYYGLISVKELKQEVKPPLTVTNTRVTKAIAQLLMRYIPGAVSRKLMAGHVGLIAELREVSVLFIHTEGVNLTAESNGGIDEATTLGQNLMLEIQKSIFQYEGSINKMAIDDKGLVTIAVFGLPPLPHDDDPLRAVRAAKALVAAIPERLGNHVKCSVGISSGQTFCGVVGSQKRREYTVMGDMVNLAARLMSMAPKLGQKILVDESTYKHSAENFGYDTTLPPTKLKGKEKPVKLYAPTDDKLDALEEEDVRIMGRQTERDDLKHMVGSLCTFHHGGTLILTGDQGSGRPALVNQLKDIAEDAGMVLLRHAKKQKKEKKNSSGAASDVSASSADGGAVMRQPSTGSIMSAAGGGGRVPSPRIKKKSSSTAIGIVKVEDDDVDGGGGGLALRPADSPRLPRVTVVNRAGTMKELNKQAANITDELVDENKHPYDVWIPILDSLVEHIAYDKAIPLDDKERLVEIVLGMLSDENRMFAFELNEIIPVLGHAVPMQPGYQLPSHMGSASVLHRIGLMILELVKAYGKLHNLVIVLKLHVGADQSKKTKDLKSWDVAQKLGRWLKARALMPAGKKARKLSTSSGAVLSKEEKEWRESPEWRGINNMILCITCTPLVRQNHFAPHVLDLLDIAEKTGTLLQLEPFSHSKRDKYLIDVLRQNHGYQQVLHTARAHVPQLIDFVSDYASGVPKYIEELIAALFEQGVVSTVEKDLAEGGMVGLKINSKYLLSYTPNAMDGDITARICKMPKKLAGKANERFERLEPRKKIILKYASTMQHFSIRMLRVLMGAEEDKIDQQRAHSIKRSLSAGAVTSFTPKALAGGAGGNAAMTLTIPHHAKSVAPALMSEELTEGASPRGSGVGGGGGGGGSNQKAKLARSESTESAAGPSKMPLDGQLKELVSLSVLEIVDTIDALNYIRLHDPQAKVGYTFQCKLQQLQVRSGLLRTQKESWNEQMAEMRDEAHSSRSIGLKHYQGSPSGGNRKWAPTLRASAQFRAQDTITQAISRKNTMRASGEALRRSASSGSTSLPWHPSTAPVPEGAVGGGGPAVPGLGERRGSVQSRTSQQSSASADMMQFPNAIPYKDQVVEGCLSVFNDMLDKMQSKLSRRGRSDTATSGEELYDSMEAFKETSRALMTTTLQMLESGDGTINSKGAGASTLIRNQMSLVPEAAEDEEAADRDDAGAGAGAGGDGGADDDAADDYLTVDGGGEGSLDDADSVASHDSVTSFGVKLGEAALTLERARSSLPAVGMEQQHAALQEENDHLRHLMGDLIVHGQDFVHHHEERSEREHCERLVKAQRSEASRSSKSKPGNRPNPQGKSCNIL